MTRGKGGKGQGEEGNGIAWTEKTMQEGTYGAMNSIVSTIFTSSSAISSTLRRALFDAAHRNVSAASFISCSCSSRKCRWLPRVVSQRRVSRPALAGQGYCPGPPGGGELCGLVRRRGGRGSYMEARERRMVARMLFRHLPHGATGACSALIILSAHVRGASEETFVQHDVQELNRVLCDNLDEKEKRIRVCAAPASTHGQACG